MQAGMDRAQCWLELRTPPRLVEISRAPHPNPAERSSRIYINTGATEMRRDGFSLDYYLACYSLYPHITCGIE